MKYAAITKRLESLGGQKWTLHKMARRMIADGQPVIELSIGEPDIATPASLIETTCNAMQRGRTAYSVGRGEPDLLDALSLRYTARLGIPIAKDQILCFPGTQTALYAIMQVIAEAGDEVLVGDPLYATYEGVIAASGASMVSVPLRPERGFRLCADDVRSRLTGRSRVLLLNTPHNPTGAVLSREDLTAIADLAIEHDLWLLVDEVYEELVFSSTSFVSPLAFEHLADRVIVASSISKSHAAPGFRSGWCVASEAFCNHLLPLSETMLFGNQPFIADMTAEAVSQPSKVAPGMVRRFEARANLLVDRLHSCAGLQVHMPDAGMFALVNVSGTGLTGNDFALGLLESHGVAVMPGSSFGNTLGDWVRVALTVEDHRFVEACDRILAFAAQCRQAVV